MSLQILRLWKMKWSLHLPRVSVQSVFEDFGMVVEKRGMGIDFDEIIAFYQMKRCEIEDDAVFMEL